MNKVSYKTLEKVVANGYCLDTWKYRYIVKIMDGRYYQYRTVCRVNRNDLDTTKAINGYKTVAMMIDGTIIRL